MRILLVKANVNQQSKAQTARSINGFLVLTTFTISLLLCLCIGYLIGEQLSSTHQNAHAETLQHVTQNQYDSELNKQLEQLHIQINQAEVKLNRLDELGKALINASGLIDESFDFSNPPPLGGPNIEVDLSIQHNEQALIDETQEMTDNLAMITAKLDQRIKQFYIISDIVKSKHLYPNLQMQNSPVTHGWVSSKFGHRKDPFTGKIAWHNGIDIASKEGEPILSVSSGIVVEAQYVRGYGNLVEIAHPNGYSTRYAHCKTILVSKGMLVDQGEVLATVGSTGRSTGPHLHFEVLLEGRSVDPKRYLKYAVTSIAAY